MTEPEDSTRPISVAELLARNGTIGSPPVGGRRRRRRGNSNSVTVAELTGEIPIVTVPDEKDEKDEKDAPEVVAEPVEQPADDVAEPQEDTPDPEAESQPADDAADDC